VSNRTLYLRWERAVVIEGFIDEYLLIAEAAASMDYSGNKSVKQSNALEDRMRMTVDEAVSLGQDAVVRLSSLLDKEPAALWAAHYLVENADLYSATLSRYVARVERARTEVKANGDWASAMGEEMCLKESKA